MVRKLSLCAVLLVQSPSDPIANLLIDGLKKLEYRGYDSAGVARYRWTMISIRITTPESRWQG